MREYKELSYIDGITDSLTAVLGALYPRDVEQEDTQKVIDVIVSAINAKKRVYISATTELYRAKGIDDKRNVLYFDVVDGVWK